MILVRLTHYPRSREHNTSLGVCTNAYENALWIANEHIREQPKYRLLTNNCQRFALFVLWSVVDSPSSMLCSLMRDEKHNQWKEYARKRSLPDHL